MITKFEVGLLAVALASIAVGGGAAAAGSANNSLTVNATLISACTVSSAATIAFGSVSTLATTDQTADTGTTFQVACSSDLSPMIYASGTRAMANGANSLAFNLSLTAGAASDNLPATIALASTLAMTQNGALQTVPIYARLLATNFKALPTGTYSNAGGVTVAVLY